MLSILLFMTYMAYKMLVNDVRIFITSAQHDFNYMEAYRLIVKDCRISNQLNDRNTLGQVLRPSTPSFDYLPLQIAHSFKVYIQSLTTASGSRLFGSVLRALDF